MRTSSFVAASFFILPLAAACSSGEPSAGSVETGDDQEVVAARMQCTIVGVDPCKYAAESDLNYCVDAITLRQSKSGRVRLEVKRSQLVAGKKRKQKAISLLSIEKTPLSALEIRASWDEGDTSIALSKIGNYKGELTLEQDFSFPVGCSQTGGARCVMGDKSFGIGDSFPDVDSCNRCTCTEVGISCTELFCPNQ